MGKLLEKLSYMSLCFFSPNHYKSKQLQDLNAGKGLSLVNSEQVFCIKSFVKGTNDFQMHTFDYQDCDKGKKVDVPKFTSMFRLP